MDFFERAHVVKIESSKKDSKSEEAVKKQLKQMLHGYKQSDNKLIKESATLVNKYEDRCFDDSTSVSGFSDLNLTNSSNEPETTQGTLVSQIDESLNVNELDFSKSTSELDLPDDRKGITRSIDSISECNDIQSLPDDIQEISLDSTAESEESSFISSLESSSSETGLDGSESEEFDADGALASKILTKLGKKGTVRNKKAKKRKLEDAEKNSVSKKDTVTAKMHGTKQKFDTNSKTAYKKDIIKNELYARCVIDESSLEESSSSQEFIENHDTSSINESISTNISSPFISITAIDMPSQSLSEILGEYRHPTVKNLPFDKQNIVSPINNCEEFSTQSMDISDVQIEEDVDSLIPELGDDPIIEDLEIDTDVVSSEVPYEESTTVYDIINDSEGLSDREASTESIEGDYLNPVKVFYGKYTCIFVLKHPTKLYIHGKVKVKALGGTTEVLGYMLQDESYEIFAPNYNYAHCLKTVECENAYYGLFSKLTSSGISVKDAEEVVTTIGEYDSIIGLTSLYSRKMDFVENNFIAADLFAKPSKCIENCFKRASQLLGCSLYLSKPWKCFEENSSWEQAITCGLENQSRTIVCGGKGTGKSTFLRYYVNRLLANGPVLVIDLDPGQAEFTVAGNVSATVVMKPLLGPNFTHLTTPDKMLNVGMINTMDNTTRYASAVEALLGYCRDKSEYQAMPWIINTMGMCNNMGLKFITHIILHARPTCLLQIDSKAFKKRFEVDLQPLTIKRLYCEVYKNDRLFRNVTWPEDLDYTFIMCSHTESNVRNNFSLAPSEERYLNFLAYFGELLNFKSGPCLLGIVPYEVKLQDLNVIMNVKVRDEAVTKVINGKIIALCHLATEDKGKVFTLGDKAVHCFGHGLIRGVDSEKGILYIVTPAPVDSLSQVNTLLYADWVPELKGQETNLPEGTAVPYRTTSVHKQRQLLVSPRRRFNPLQLLKLSRSS